MATEPERSPSASRRRPAVAGAVLAVLAVLGVLWLAGGAPVADAQTPAAIEGPAAAAVPDGAIAVTPGETDDLNDPHVFTITATAIHPGGAPVVFGSVEASVAPQPESISSTCDAPVVTEDVATCTVTISRAAAAVYRADATVRLTVAGVPIVRSTDAAVAGSGPGGTTAAVKTYDDASVPALPIMQFVAPVVSVRAAPPWIVRPLGVAVIVLLVGGGTFELATRRYRRIRC